MQGNFFYKKIGGQISYLRKKKNISQYELADKAQINRSYLAMVELGKANPTVKFLKKISRVLKIKMRDLLGDV